MEYVKIDYDMLPDLAVMYVETFNAKPWCDQWTEETAYNRLDWMMGSEMAYGLVAVADNQKVCGLVLGEIEQYYDGKMFVIKELCVRNALRGLGIGNQLMEQLERHMRKRGVKSIILNTSRGELTERFYQKRGYEMMEDMIMMGLDLTKEH